VGNWRKDWYSFLHVQIGKKDLLIGGSRKFVPGLEYLAHIIFHRQKSDSSKDWTLQKDRPSWRVGRG
jgi:hypothetical protein